MSKTRSALPSPFWTANSATHFSQGDVGDNREEMAQPSQRAVCSSKWAAKLGGQEPLTPARRFLGLSFVSIAYGEERFTDPLLCDDEAATDVAGPNILGFSQSALNPVINAAIIAPPIHIHREMENLLIASFTVSFLKSSAETAPAFCADALSKSDTVRRPSTKVHIALKFGVWMHPSMGSINIGITHISTNLSCRSLSPTPIVMLYLPIFLFTNMTLSLSSTARHFDTTPSSPKIYFELNARSAG
ncbi:MAG: hypothetical protein WAK03_00760, partial [Methylocystis sp.]